jgi:GT2 family glycosyltransferase
MTWGTACGAPAGAAGSTVGEAADRVSPDAQPASDQFMTVVIATRDRAAELGRTLSRLAELPERPAVIVVDNASRDGTADLVRREHPGVRLIRLPGNQGAVARNIGVTAADTRFVAFCDDDSWWEPGALDCAARALDSCPELAVVAGHILVGPGGEPDPVNAAMAGSPLEQGGLPGPRVLGFLACGAVVRRAAFLAVGGFSDLLVFGGEEKLLAMDLAAAGWTAAYLEGARARHWPSARRDQAGRERLDARNEVLTAWLRRPARSALAATAALARRLGRDPAAAGALASLLRLLPRALRQRRVLPAATEADVRALARWDRERRP